MLDNRPDLRSVPSAVIVLVAAVLLLGPQSHCATYYISNDGDDTSDGVSPASAWQTLAAVNFTKVEPGDAFLFRRGDSWRGQLFPKSGDENAPVRYGAYGAGPKPLLLGSVEMNHPEDWVHEGGNIWSTHWVRGEHGSLWGDAGTNWNLHSEAGAKVTVKRSSGDGGNPRLSFTCVASGEKSNHIQLYCDRFAIHPHRAYTLTFRARSTKPFDVEPPALMKSGTPWTRYASPSPKMPARIDREAQTFAYTYPSLIPAADARLTFFLGGILPEGAGLVMEDVQLHEADASNVLHCDVGNIIFDHEASCGVKKWNPEDMKAQGQYWYDEDKLVLKLYSEKNPAEYYSDIECALRYHIISQNSVHHVIYEQLALMYGGAHGIGGGSTAYITVRDCDFGFIGGGDQRGGDHTVRFGNGVEFWGAAHDCLVERCRLWEIYDAALTNQSSGPKTPHYNITYRNNVIWNSEYSYEYWNRPEASTTRNVVFENNTCVNAGHGWGHTQRSDPSGRHLCFYTSPAQAEGITIRNNIFFEANKNAFYAPTWTKEAIDALVMDRNCWYQAEGAMMSINGKAYTMAEFAKYQAEWRKEPHSIVAIPKFVDAANLDFRLTKASRCIDAGGTVDHTADFAGAPVPTGKAVDIGAFEYTGE